MIYGVSTDTDAEILRFSSVPARVARRFETSNANDIVAYFEGGVPPEVAIKWRRRFDWSRGPGPGFTTHDVVRMHNRGLTPQIVLDYDSRFNQDKAPNMDAIAPISEHFKRLSATDLIMLHDNGVTPGLLE